MNNKENILLNNPRMKENPFSVPDDYFETNLIKIREKLSCLQNPNAFTVPEDYFESNALRIKEKVLGSSPPFDVPKNYFEDNSLKLSKTIIQLSQTNTEASTNSNQSRKRRIIYFNVMKYAVAAASITGIIWGIYLYLQPSAKESIIQQPCQTIACLTKQDILSKAQVLDEEVIEGAISDEAIDEHFNSPASFNNDTNYNSVDESF